MSQLKIVANITKGSPLTGSAWVNVLVGGISTVEQAEITAPFSEDPNQAVPNKIESVIDYDGISHLTLTVVNSAETIGPIQIYGVEFYLDDKKIPLNWQTAIKGKPLRFGGQPNTTITNPHVNDPNFNGWCSVPDISPGMSVTWGLADLIAVHPL